ncbi:MAG: glycoside hydrolase [Treponema sp.]|jgi:hypothetical protein|nr:glycoside hydrolase [Treponema sp.]
MKRSTITLTLLAPLLLVFAACTSSSGGNLPPEPEQIPAVRDEIPPDEGPETPPARPEAGVLSPENPEEFETSVPPEELPVSEFEEVWAYILQDREDALKEGLPISDLGYFGAEVDSYGRLIGVPNPRVLPPFGGRVHLVVTCNSYPLTHFVLKYDTTERRELIAALLWETRNFDGLQIDFEYIPGRDREQFFSFLGELRAGLKDKFFSVALKARTRTLANDVHDYERIGPLVDRILVMAYDEHWATSAPGPIASMDWCRDVASYAHSVIGREKLIMGLPFYGRAWIDPSPAKAYTYPQIETLLHENSIREIHRDGDIPNFEYETPVVVRGYYEDAASLAARLTLYRSMDVRAVGFWRLGQENTAVWDSLRLSP